MRWLVLGATGMLGTDLVARLRHDGLEPTTPGRQDLDLNDADAVSRAVRGHDVIVNCAAWTAVDEAEEHEGEAFELNATVPQVVAAAAARHGTRMVQISTDYVFDGQTHVPYPEEALLAPRSAYGRTKAAGEWAVRSSGADHLVVRTAWLYGAHGGCFPKTMARLATENGAVTVVDDQFGQPTWTADVADLVVRLLQGKAPTGTYHATSSGQTSWCGFAREVITALGMDPAIVSPTTTEAFPRRAPRPSYSVLAHTRLEDLGIDPIGGWRDRWRQAAAEVLA